MAAAAQPRVSGAVLLDQIQVMEQLVGAERMSSALAALPDEVQAEIRTLMRVSWCSVESANALLEAVAAEAGRTPSAFQADVVRTGVERTFRSIWRIILRFTGDEALVRRTPLIYSKTYDSGQMDSRIARPGRAELELTGWLSPPQLDLEGLAVGIETVLRVAGRADARVAFDRRRDGAFFVATWRV